MSKPVRLQLSRRKGFDLQALSIATNGLPAINVARPSKWGNPFPIDDEGTQMHCLTLDLDGTDRTDRATAAVDLFKTWLTSGKVNYLVGLFLPSGLGRAPIHRHIRRDLAGKNLACWCAVDAPCHADVLLELANPRGTECR